MIGDLSHLSARQLAGLAATLDDAQLRELVGLAGTDRVVARVLAEFPARRRPEHAPRLRATVGFVVGPPPDPARHHLRLDPGHCSTGPGLPEGGATTTLRCGRVAFIRLVTLTGSVPRLLATGRLRVRGNPLLAAALPHLFSVPRPS